MIKLNCINCVCIEYTMSDGLRCDYRDIDYLNDYIDTEMMFCKEYYYNYCLECEHEGDTYYDCGLCSRK